MAVLRRTGTDRCADVVSRLVAQVPTQGVTTLYARIGDSLAWTCLLALIATVVLALLPAGLLAPRRHRVEADRESVVA
jgi:hypothetical protein